MGLLAKATVATDGSTSKPSITETRIFRWPTSSAGKNGAIEKQVLASSEKQESHIWLREFFLSLLQPSGSGLSSIEGFRLTMHNFFVAHDKDLRVISG